MEGAAGLSSELLSSSNWEVYKDAFAPPPPRRPTRAWERAPVAAHAPRLRGQKIWKKVNGRSQEGKENGQDAQEELEKAGNGPRKKPRLRCAKENIGDADAQWLDSLQPHAYGDDTLEAIEDKGRTSMAAQNPDAMQMVPRKRTNADRLISPRKSVRKSPFHGQRSNISPMAALLPITDKLVQKRRSVRKNIRLSMLHQQVIKTAEPSNEEQRTVISPSGIVDTTEPASTPPQKLYLRGQFVDKEAEAETQAVVHLSGSPMDSISSATQCDTCGEVGSLVADSLQTKGSDSEDLLQDKGLYFAEHNISRGAEAINSGLLLCEQKGSPEKTSPGRVGVFWDQSFVPFPVEQPADSTQKSKEPILSVSLKKEPPTVRCIEGREDAIMATPKEVSLTPKKLQRRVSQRVGARRSSRNGCISISEGSTAQSTMPPEVFVQPGHHDDIIVENQTIAPLANAAPSQDTGSLPKTIRTPSTETAEGPLLPAISPSITVQEKDDLLSMIESGARNGNVSVIQRIESPYISRLNPAGAEELAELGAEIVAQALEETTTNDEPGPNISHCPSSQSLVEELCMQTQVLRASYFERDSFSQSRGPEAQLYQLPDSSSTPVVVASVEGGCNEVTVGSLAVVKPTSALLSTTNSLPEAIEDGEQDVTDTITSEGINSLVGSTTVNTLIPSYEHDDTDMLRNFLTRVKANKAANAEQITQKRRSLPHSPLRLPLGDPDGINGSPSSPRAEDEFDVGLPTASPDKGRNNNTPASDDGDVTEARPVRRSGRTKLPVKSHLPAPCFIPVRRLGQEGDNTITLRRNVEKELAALTRVNTRKNKGGALFPADVLAKKIEEKDDPVSRQRALKEMFDDKMQKQKRGKKGKCVAWAEELAQYKNVRGRKLKVEKEANVGKEKKKTAPREEQNSVPRRGIASKVALGMAANGTPAPKRKMRGYS